MDNPAAPIPSASPQPVVSYLPVEASSKAGPAESPNRRWLLWSAIGLTFLIFGITIGIFGARFLNQSTTQSQISSYEDCLAAKGSIVQYSYPATCVTATGQRFVQPLTDEEKQGLQPPDPYREPASSAATSDWKTYTNQKYSFSFKHPNFDEKCCGLAGAVSDNPTAVITLADITTTMPGTDAPFDGLSVYIIPNENNLTLDQYIEKEKVALFRQFEAMADLNMVHQGRVINTKVADQPAVSLIDYSWDGITRTYFKHPNSAVIIEISKSEQSPDHFSFYDQILSTFKFLDRGE